MSHDPRTDAQDKRQVSLSGRIQATWRAVGRLLKNTVRSGKQRFTIMFIPHSEKRVLNVQLNSFALIFLAVVVVVVVSGFFYLATVFSGSERLVDETGTRLLEVEASLEQVRQGVSEFLQVYDVFDEALQSTLRRMEISAASGSDLPASSGDLATMLDLEEIQDGDLREMLDLQRVVASLNSSIGPLTEISDALELNRQLLTDIPNLWPVINGLGFVTMEFGPNIHPIQGIWYMHKGIDIAHYPGTPIVSAANGKVTKAGVDQIGYGGYVEIDHSYGFRTKYGHMETVLVTEGEEVQQGQRLGTMGNTGISTGSHLDFQMWIGTENIDPAYFLKLSKPDFNRRTRARY